MANDSHLLVIENIYGRRHQTADLIATEEVLYGTEHTIPNTNHIDYHFRRFIENFSASEIEKEFRKREKRIKFAYKLGLERPLSKFARLARKEKFITKFDF